MSLAQLLVGGFTLAYLRGRLSPRNWQAFLDVFTVLVAFCVGLVAIPAVIFALPAQSPAIPGLTILAIVFVVLSPVWTIALMRFLAKRREKLSSFRDDEQH